MTINRMWRHTGRSGNVGGWETVDGCGFVRSGAGLGRTRNGIDDYGGSACLFVCCSMKMGARQCNLWDNNQQSLKVMTRNINKLVKFARPRKLALLDAREKSSRSRWGMSVCVFVFINMTCVCLFVCFRFLTINTCGSITSFGMRRTAGSCIACLQHSQTHNTQRQQHMDYIISWTWTRYGHDGYHNGHDTRRHCDVCMFLIWKYMSGIITAIYFYFVALWMNIFPV